MKFLTRIIATISLFFLIGGSACLPAKPLPAAKLKVLAVETFLGDIAQNVAGDRAQINTLIPDGLDPHSFEPTPQDVARIADSSVLIVNGFGLEEWLTTVLNNAGGSRLVIVATSGLVSRNPRPGEPVGVTDPHFWLDPTKVLTYVENIRAGLSQADPGGAAIYASNAAAYKAKLNELDQWVKTQIDQIPPARRLLVTNHESFGYYADHYGLQIIGTIIPNVSPDASPSAQQLSQLVDQINKTGAPAIFLETGSNPQLAQQIAQETKVKVITEFYTHSITPANGPAPTYLDMIRFDTTIIVQALKG
jgi:ABC-type Zn uptake system ZnuABC Zn-binding protein ZnuA